MEKRFGQRNTGKLLAAAIGATGLAGLGASQADASLLIDVRATGATTSADGVVNGKSVVIANAGDTVTLGIFARVTGTDAANNETLNSVYGLLNSVGGLKGNMSGNPSTLNPPFTDSGAQNGSVVDWDSDGDLDIGASVSSSSGTGKFFARNGTAGGFTGLTPVTTGPGASSEVLIGQVVFTATDLSGSSTLANFVRRSSSGANVAAAALWFEDGSTVSKNSTNSVYGAGSPVEIVVPEPASLGLMALAGVGLLGRRRKA